MATKGHTKKRREEARQRMYHDLVFEAAEAVFAEKGFDATTMQDVATEAGVSLTTLYSAFPGKQELYDEIRSTRSGDFLAAMTAAIASEEEPLAALASGVRSYVEFLVANRDFLRLHLREAQAWAVHVPENRIDGIDGMTQVLERGMESGVFYRGDPYTMALVGIAIMQVWLGRMVQVEVEDSGRIVAEILEQLERVYCIERRGDLAAA